MAKDDLLLPEEMGKLKLDCSNNNIGEENRFVNTIHQESSYTWTTYKRNCFCSKLNFNKNVTIAKRNKCHRILKEPILKVIQICGKGNIRRVCMNKNQQIFSSSSDNTESDLNLCALVDNCNQLKISTDNKTNSEIYGSSDETKWWNQTSSVVKKCNLNISERSPSGGSCSQQALNPPPCDVTIDELASYFETMVHIPKKMSSMAEMMYI